MESWVPTSVSDHDVPEDGVRVGRKGEEQSTTGLPSPDRDQKDHPKHVYKTMTHLGK